MQKYGLRDHPTHTHEVSPFDGVTLACTRDQEAVSQCLMHLVRWINFGVAPQLMYRDKDGATTPIQDLNVICNRIPVHVIFGGNPDYLWAFPRYHFNSRFSFPFRFQTPFSTGRAYGSEIRSKVCFRDSDSEYRPLGIRYAY